MNRMSHSSHSSHSSNHYIIMFVIMLLSGLLTTMNIYADKFSDIRFSLNDIYMTLLMTGWMFAFMGIFYKEIKVFVFGIILVIFNIWAIRSQFMISQSQYLLGMIPHHSMAVHMSKKLLNKNNNIGIQNFLKNIIKTQEKEIDFMKS